MWSSYTRQMGRWLREAILGPAYFVHRRRIAKSLAWDTDEILRYMKLPVGQSSSTVRTKTDYKNNLNQFSHYCFPGLVKKVSTGGTTGSPFSFYMDTFARRQKERAYMFDIWSEIGYQPFDLRVVFRGNISDKLIEYKWFENAYYISPSILSNGNLHELLEFLSKLEPFFFHVYPSSLLTFISLTGEERFNNLPIRGVFAGSEAFPESQMCWFQEKFGTPIAHWYGHSEYAVLAKKCPKCSLFHFYPTYGGVEFKQNQSGFSSVIATSYNKMGTRFEGYDTQDLAMPAASKCSNQFPSVSSIVGREQEFFIDGTGQQYAFGPFLFGIHGSFWDCLENIQFKQDTAGEMAVVLVAEMEKRNEIEQTLRHRFPKSLNLKFSYAESIQTTKSGKHRYYISSLPL